MEYLLVLQLPSSSPGDCDLLLSLEEAITENIGNLGIVDGHDMGSGETNIFLFAKDQKREVAAIAAKKDCDIDFSGMPPVVDWSGAEVGKFYRPTKRPVTMRLDVDVLKWLQADGRGYQTKANQLLRPAMLHFTRNRRQKLASRSGKSPSRRRNP
jgi:uncharacterized protein (DUF4415 family)